MTALRSRGQAGHRLRAALVALCVTELTSWGILYYSFPVVLTEVVRDTGWPATAAMGAFSAGLVTSAAATAPIGWLLDRHGPRRVMTTGSVVGTGALLAVAAAPGLPWLVAAWTLAGLAQAMLLYPPAFAALTRWYGAARIRPLTTLSLVGGLASTVHAPLTALLVTHFGWRVTYVVLAGLLGLITIPLHYLFLTPPWPAASGRSPAHRAVPVRDVARSRAFLLLTAGMALGGLGLYAATTNLVPLLIDRGATATTAAVALGLCGAGQLLGRLGFPGLTRRTGPRTRTTAVLAAGAAAIMALALISRPLWMVIVAAVVIGAVRGAYTLLQATAVSDRWGTHRFATLNALATTPAAFAIALSPVTGAFLSDRMGGYLAAFTLLAAAALTGAALATATDPRGPAPEL